MITTCGETSFAVHTKRTDRLRDELDQIRHQLAQVQQRLREIDNTMREDRPNGVDETSQER